MKRFLRETALAIGAVFLISNAYAQFRGPSKPCPVYKSPAVRQHIDAAYRLLDHDLPPTLIPSLFIMPRGAGLCAPARVPQMKLQAMQKTYAFKAFDQLYYVGNAFVGSFALTTPKGIILFDTMWDDQDAKDIIEPGLRKLGLNPADIKYIIVTHGHIDHWGGAKYFQDKYKSRVMQSAIDWVLTEGGTQKSMSFMGRPPQAPPKRDLVVHDGAVFSLGSTNVNLYILPGHTPGSLGIILPVTDHGVPHVAAMFGGNGLPMHLQKDIGPGPERDAGLLAYIASVKRFTRLGREAGADVAISTHPIFDGTIQYGAEIAHRAAGAPNPWVLGKNRWQRYMKVQLEVAETVKAMEIEHPVFKRGP